MPVPIPLDAFGTLCAVAFHSLTRRWQDSELVCGVGVTGCSRQFQPVAGDGQIRRLPQLPTEIALHDTDQAFHRNDS